MQSKTVREHRPSLNMALSGSEFRSWYWLKDELTAFCRSAGISASGSKHELADRIHTFLDGKAPPPSRPVRTQRGQMPESFAPTDRIGAGWRCSVALGAFFKAEFGPSFRFNKAMRDFIHDGEGQTLAEAMDCYRQSISGDRTNSEIASQFEYNQHMREFFAANPGASRTEAIAAWWGKRGQRKAAMRTGRAGG